MINPQRPHHLPHLLQRKAPKTQDAAASQPQPASQPKPQPEEKTQPAAAAVKPAAHEAPVADKQETKQVKPAASQPAAGSD